MTVTVPAIIGLGIVVQLAAAATPNVKTTMDLVSDIGTPPVAKFDQVDASTYDQGTKFRQYIAGLADPGEFSFVLNFIPGNATDVYLRDAQGTAQHVTVTMPDGSMFDFDGVITQYGWDKAPIDGKLTSTCQLKVSGEVSFTDASAPVNAVLPSVSASSLAHGAVFTANVGEWLPAGTEYTFQWKRDGANISGATGKDYISVSGDATHGLAVAVTAINGTGSTTATSIQTANLT